MQQHAARLQEGDPGPVRTVLEFPRKPTLYDTIADQRLQWFPEIGVGYFPVTGSPYDQAYFDRFAKQAKDPIGRRLMKSRVEFVNRFWGGLLLDIGIGSGAFIEKRNAIRPATLGYDINPAAIVWLTERGLFCDPWRVNFNNKLVPAVSMWDVIEHVDDFKSYLEPIERWLFLSLPIFRDADHVLRSKHFRKDEHFWYFTEQGLIRVMGDLGFDLIKQSNMEIEAGREDIGAFAFRRK